MERLFLTSSLLPYPTMYPASVLFPSLMTPSASHQPTCVPAVFDSGTRRARLAITPLDRSPPPTPHPKGTKTSQAWHCALECNLPKPRTRKNFPSQTCPTKLVDGCRYRIDTCPSWHRAMHHTYGASQVNHWFKCLFRAANGVSLRSCQVDAVSKWRASGISASPHSNVGDSS